MLQSQGNKNSVLLAQNRYIDQWNIIEDPEIRSHSYPHLIFNKDTKNIHSKKESFINKEC
jgi:hypothetical protein